ncbi:hypothetical protein PN497_19515 [Sphaerospermopsis kisseleviana CS-549]|uniref:Uncharacterized protein n=1 Tax=Sphaerospermopsis kisseleviana CS-549 TaxID=3021783 RepID=A0ABT4ZXR0_9CYAN|nr:hypothetical protein [Sphaerospermopsis kisseleviana]MDB9443528.1 hypothetical protein [Sphaerospermopsis kisseleviana CS-549]BAZ80676.1 hypothetical protein NIES73_19390 [Sphaerospermopsis kisseleviana NIES-73]
MELITLTAVVTAVVTILGKPLEKMGENLGDVIWKQTGKLITKLRDKQQAPSLTASIEAGETAIIDYGQAVLELTEAAANDREIAEAVLDVEAAVNNDQSETAKEIKAKAKKIESDVKSQTSVINNFEKIADVINADRGSNVASQININNPTYNY